MYYKNDTVVFWDGRFVNVADVRPALFSQTLHYGNGVFEGLRAYETPEGLRIFRAEDHFKRLLISAEKMRLSIGYTIKELVAISYELLEKNRLTEAYIRPLIYAGEHMELTASPTVHLSISAWKWGRLLGDKQLNVGISSFQRPDMKSFYVHAKICGNYVNSVLATNEAKSKGYDDAIMLDHQGLVTGGTGANIFVEQDEVLFTPPASEVMAGITRMTVMELARDMGLKVKEKKFTPDFMIEADGAFFTGTAAAVAPIGTIEGTPMKMEWPDTLGYILSRKYQKLVTQNDTYNWTLI